MDHTIGPERDYSTIVRDGVKIPAVIWGGVPRVLASFPTLPGAKARAPTWSEANPVLPRSEWRAIDLDSPQVPILDQKSYSSCTGQSCGGALMRARVLSGQPAVILSPTYPYTCNNNGRDAGAMIGDVIATFAERGTCLMQYCDQDIVYEQQVPEIARDHLDYKIGDYCRAESFDDICSGLVLGWFPVYALQVGDLWSKPEPLDKDGCPVVYKGPGNHAMHATGLSFSRRRGWMPRGVNSWGASWGAMGLYNATEAHYDATAYQDAWLVRVAALAPDDLVGPPVKTSRERLA